MVTTFLTLSTGLPTELSVMKTQVASKIGSLPFAKTYSVMMVVKEARPILLNTKGVQEQKLANQPADSKNRTYAVC